MSIKTCLFDMGNVLVHFSHQRMCENVASVCGVSAEQAEGILMGSGLQRQIECGEITEEQFHQQLEGQLNRAVDFDALRHACADIFWLNDSMVPLLEELQNLGLRLVLLSNTSITHLRFIQQNFDILNRFDALTTSYEVGVQKPGRAIYEDALSKANCGPENCFYTDDIEDYVLRARTFGIHAEVYTQTAGTRKSLRDLGVRVNSE